MNNSIILLLGAIAQVFAQRNESAIAEYVSLAGTLVESGMDVRDELEALVAEIQMFVATETEPTDADFDRVARRRQSLIDQLHQAASQDTGDTQ